MNSKRSKWLKRLVESQNPVLLTLIRNKYGERTKEMGSRQIYKAAKKMWYQGEIQRVTKWPTLTKQPTK
jgi:hypothetical protein